MDEGFRVELLDDKHFPSSFLTALTCRFLTMPPLPRKGSTRPSPGCHEFSSAPLTINAVFRFDFDSFLLENFRLSSFFFPQFIERGQ